MFCAFCVRNLFQSRSVFGEIFRGWVATSARLAVPNRFGRRANTTAEISAGIHPMHEDQTPRVLIKGSATLQRHCLARPIARSVMQSQKLVWGWISERRIICTIASRSSAFCAPDDSGCDEPVFCEAVLRLEELHFCWQTTLVWPSLHHWNRSLSLRQTQDDLQIGLQGSGRSWGQSLVLRVLA